MKHIIYDLPEFVYLSLRVVHKRQGLPSYPNAVRDAQGILAERAKAAKRCPNCGGPLDINGCCKKCNICVLTK